MRLLPEITVIWDNIGVMLSAGQDARGCGLLGMFDERTSLRDRDTRKSQPQRAGGWSEAKRGGFCYNIPVVVLSHYYEMSSFKGGGI